MIVIKKMAGTDFGSAGINLSGVFNGGDAGSAGKMRITGRPGAMRDVLRDYFRIRGWAKRMAPITVCRPPVFRAIPCLSGKIQGIFIILAFSFATPYPGIPLKTPCYS
jgi:hypothetical protein